ncbi:hypothetical protein REPUB_Repub05bG0074000 [Reevesia pubescens]
MLPLDANLIQGGKACDNCHSQFTGDMDQGFWLKPVEDDERKTLNKINLMVFPGSILLKKPLYQFQNADGQSGVGDTPSFQKDNSAEHLRREESTETVIHSLGDQSAKSVQPVDDNCYANQAADKIESELVGDKNLQELEIDGTKEITDTGGEEPCDKPALRVVENTRLGICMKGQPVDESIQYSGLNCCSKEVRTELEDRLRIGTSQESPASEIDGCCGDDEAGSELKVESEQQSDCNHSAEMAEKVVEKSIQVVERRENSLQEQFSEVSCEEPNWALVSSVKTSCICNETQVSVEEQLQKKDCELDVK